jgi:WD40 repeat protein
MSRLTCNRWIRWSLFVSALVALGIGIYRIQPPEPMCELVGDLQPERFVDGKLVTLPGQEIAMVKAQGAVKVQKVTARRFRPALVQMWNPTNGEEVARFGKVGQRLGAYCLSVGNRYLAAEVHADDLGEDDHGYKIKSFLLVDLVAGTSQEMPADEALNGELQMSPTGKLLFHRDERGKWLRVFDTATGRILAKRRSAGLIEITDETVVHRVPLEPIGYEIEIWDIRDGKPILTIENAEFFCWAARPRRLLVGRSLGDADQTRRWEIWNLNTRRIEGQIDLGEFPVLSECGTRLAVKESKDDCPSVEIRELPSGRLIGTHRGEVFTMYFSDEGRFLAVAFSEPLQLSIFDTATGKSLWEHHTGDDVPLPMLFGPASASVYVYQHEPRQLSEWNWRTGRKEKSIPLPAMENGFHLPNLDVTPDHGSLLIQDSVRVPAVADSPFWAHFKNWLPWLNDLPEAKNDLAVVLDIRSGRERFRLSGWSIDRAMLSDDGQTLVTVHAHDNMLRCWDVDACKPLRWAVGVPAGLASACILFAWWRGRRRMGAAKTT